MSLKTFDMFEDIHVVMSLLPSLPLMVR